MRKIIISASVCFVLFLLSFSSYSQESTHVDRMIEKIDSICKVNQITQAEVYFTIVNQPSDNVRTENSRNVKKSKFYFDDVFLVINNRYFNMDKLVFFEIKDDYFRFYFQNF